MVVVDGAPIFVLDLEWGASLTARAGYNFP